MTPSGPHAGPALAMILIDEVPAGLQALDALLKEAPVDLVRAGTIQCGLYLILLNGGLEAIERSVRRGRDLAAGHTIDFVILPDAESRILSAIRDQAVRWPAPGDTLGMIQTAAPPDMLRALDSALKGTSVELVELRVGDGLGGRAIASLWGETPDVEAAIELAERAIGADHGGSLSTSIIRNAEPELVARLAGPTTFFKEWRG